MAAYFKQMHRNYDPFPRTGFSSSEGGEGVEFSDSLPESTVLPTSEMSLSVSGSSISY